MSKRFWEGIAIGVIFGLLLWLMIGAFGEAMR